MLPKITFFTIILMKKILLIIIDGLGDKPIPQLGNKTPLEAAKTPNLDYLVKNGICGLMEPSFTGAIPTSEEGHFSLFDYNPKEYPVRRGIFTVQGAGIKMKKGDVALRGNFGTVDEELNMIDRRAGRINNTQPLIKSLNGMIIEEVKFLIKSAKGHRIGIVLRNKNLSSRISDSDPHYGKLGKKVQKVVPLDKSKEAKFTAQVLNKFLEESHQLLKEHPLNKERKKKGKLPANYILTRGASSLIKLPSFEEKYNLKACCIAGKPLYQQIGRILRMDLIKVKGANGLPNTNLEGKVQAARKALKRYGFVFLHIKATDSLAEDGNFLGKKEFVEKIDKNLKTLLKLKNVLIVVTADHSTCCSLKRHCAEPIPILIYGNGQDSVKEFSEKACKKGGLSRFEQLKLMTTLLNLDKN
jgi:2,3-bisphosphoglycerate-independent phosphoglycerate mutase